MGVPNRLPGTEPCRKMSSKSCLVDDADLTPLLKQPANSPQLEPALTGDLSARGAAEGRTRAASLSVVIPVYNEQETLQLVYARVTEAVAALQRGYEIIFVNDG